MWTKSYIGAAMMAVQASALDNGLGKVPRMGWNTWNKFGCDISEKPVETAID